MNCTTLTSILKGCDSNIGGIMAVYINDQDNVTSVTESEPTWEVTAITKTSPFIPFEFRRNTGNFTEEASIDLVNGSSFYTQVINLMFHRREASKSASIKILGEGQRDLAIIVKDTNGKYWYFPNAQLSSVGEGSGTAKADGSKYAVGFTAENVDLAKEVDESIIAGLLTV